MANKQLEQFADLFHYPIPGSKTETDADGNVRESQPTYSSYSFGPSVEHDTDKYGVGSSIFHLVTYIKPDLNSTNSDAINYVMVSGLLNELPQFSFSLDYAEGPGKATTEKLTQLFDNKLFNITNALGSSDNSYNNLINTGSMSNEMYAGTKQADINLKFRIYTQDTLGQSPISQWKDFLGKYAVPSSQNEITIEHGINNIISGIRNATGIGGQLINIFSSDLNESTDNMPAQGVMSTEETAEKHIQDFAECKAKLDVIINNAIGNIKTEVNAILQTNEKITKEWGNSFSINAEIVQKSNGIWESVKSALGYTEPYALSLTVTNGSSTKANTIIPLYKYAAFSQDLSDIAGADYYLLAAGDSSNPPTINMDLISKKLTELKDQIIKNWTKSDEGFTVACNKIKEIIQASNKIDEAQADPIKKNKIELTESLKKLKSLMNKTKPRIDAIQRIGSKRFNTYRAAGDFNARNGLGEKLFHLFIYNNFLLKKNTPLTVVIKDWEIKPSTEYIVSDAAYYDISITCGFDQVYSIDQWNNCIDLNKLKSM